MNCMREEPWRPDWPYQVFELERENTAINMPNGRGKSTIALGVLGLLASDKSLVEWRNKHCAPATAGMFIRAIIRDLMVATRALGTYDTVFGCSAGVRRLHSVRTAVKLTGKHPKRLNRLLHAAGFLDDDAMLLSAHQAAFPADTKAELFLERVKRSMPMGAARRYINASRDQFDLLLKAGLVAPFIRGGASLKDHAFDKQDLDDFLARLLEGVPAVTADDPNFVQIPLAANLAHPRCPASRSTATTPMFSSLCLAGYLLWAIPERPFQARTSLREADGRGKYRRTVCGGLQARG